MNNKWDQRFLELSRLISTWSKDPSVKVGCVIADKKHVISLGYNGFAAGVSDCAERFADRSTKLDFMVHAESNAIALSRGNLSGTTAYIYPLLPCSRCASQLINAGVTRIVVPNNAVDKDTLQRWVGNFLLTRTILNEAGIVLDVIPMSNP